MSLPLYYGEIKMQYHIQNRWWAFEPPGGFGWPACWAL